MRKILGFLRVYRYEIIALLVGAIIMIYELVGARLISPYLGTSLYVWTAVIGVILGALAVGYAIGGRVADKHADQAVLTRILLAAAFIMAIGLLVQTPLLEWLASNQFDTRLKAFIAAFVLFAPSVVFLGMVSPYLAKLKVTDLKTAGQSIGGLYAAGTLGSIIGTFMAGYWLISYVGSRMLGWMLVTAILVVALATSARLWSWRRNAVLVGLVLSSLLLGLAVNKPSRDDIVYDGDSAYARYQVLARDYQGSPAHLLVMDNEGIQSGVDLSNPHSPLFDYAKRFVEAADAHSEPKSILMIGGGTFTVPSVLAERFPNTKIDVVEIDPKLTQLAKDYFYFSPSKNLRVINQDGRVFLNQNSQKYDIIFMDAYGAISPPFQLTTTQAVGQIERSLAPNGIVVVNAIATLTGKRSEYAQAQFATYRSRFRHVYWRQARIDRSLDERQNVIIVAGNTATAQAVDQQLTGKPIPAPLASSKFVLTDDFAPIERLTTN